jgi:hypothetical protein
MRFKHRKKVDLPHPDGPISAVTFWGWISRLILDNAFELP